MMSKMSTESYLPTLSIVMPDLIPHRHAGLDYYVVPRLFILPYPVIPAPEPIDVKEITAITMGSGGGTTVSAYYFLRKRGAHCLKEKC